MAPTFYKLEEDIDMKKIWILPLIYLLIPTSTFASGIPVYDASGFAQMVTQLDQMSKDYQKQLEQLEQAVKLVNPHY